MAKDFYLLIDNVRSVYNVGSIFRTAEAVGVKKIFLGGISGVEKFGTSVKINPKIAKTALEGINLPWEHSENSFEKIKALKKEGIGIVSLEILPESVDFRQAKYQFPLCLVVGHERFGVDEQINHIADQTIQIPMFGGGKSLNVAVAAAVALYQIKFA